MSSFVTVSNRNTMVNTQGTEAVRVPSVTEQATTAAAEKAVKAKKTAADLYGEKPKISKEETVEIAEVMNDVSKMLNSRLTFDVYEDTDRVYVQFIDIDTKEVIKQMPPEELLELSAKIQKMVGLILDKYV